MRAWLVRIAFMGCLALVMPTFAGTASLPATTRKVILEKVDQGYLWKTITAPVPTPGDHQILLHVRAVGLNRGDYELLAEVSPADLSGRIVASDAAGDVVAVGKSVKGIRVGERVTSLYFSNWVDGPASSSKLSGVHGVTVDGVLGDYVVLDDTAIAPAPKSLTYEEVSALPTAGLTGWMATVGQFKIQRGDIVVVQGTGGVSIFSLQFAAAAGARIIVTSSSDDKLQRAKALGAADGINYRTHATWSEQIMQITQEHGADYVVDVGGKSSLEQSVKSLAYGGTLSIVGGLTGYDGSITAMGLLGKTATAKGIYVGSRADYLRMSKFIDAKQLHPVIDKVFEFDQYQQALDYMKAGNFVGKVVLKM